MPPEREVFVGNVTDYTFPDVSIDDLVFGVKAIDKDGNESLVSPFLRFPAGRGPALLDSLPRPVE